MQQPRRISAMADCGGGETGSRRCGAMGNRIYSAKWPARRRYCTGGNARSASTRPHPGEIDQSPSSRSRTKYGGEIPVADIRHEHCAEEAHGERVAGHHDRGSRVRSPEASGALWPGRLLAVRSAPSWVASGARQSETRCPITGAIIAATLITPITATTINTDRSTTSGARTSLRSRICRVRAVDGAGAAPGS